LLRLRRIEFSVHTGVTLSRDTGQVTHRIAANVDAERLRLIGELNDAHMVTSIYQMKGIGPTLNGRNGEGDPYYTDGEIWVARLVIGGKEAERLAEMLPAPALIQMKDTAFSWGSRIGGTDRADRRVRERVELWKIFRITRCSCSRRPS
jgi:hypothetical protein